MKPTTRSKVHRLFRYLSTAGLSAVTEPRPRDAPVDRIATEALATLDRYLGFFYEKGHPGRPCLRTGWVHVDHIAQDRARVERLWRELQASREKVADV